MAHQHCIHTRQLSSKTEQAIRLFLRSMGGFALAVCLLFWLHLLFA